MSTPAVYTRRVSFNEKLYLAMEALDPGFCIQIAVEGTGEVDEGALSNAVATAAAAHPGARLVRTGALGWMRWVATGPVPPVRRVDGWTQGEAPPAVARPLSPESGPTCEVVYAPGPPTRIVFRCFHGVMDASGLLVFAEDVFRALRDESPMGADCALSDTEVVTALVGPRTRANIKSDRRTVNGAQSTARTGNIARQLAFEGPLPGLVARIASTLAGYARQFHTGPFRAMIPVDLRNYKRDVRATGNMTYPLILEVDPEKTWRRLHREILKHLGAKAPLHLDPSERAGRWAPVWAIKTFYRLWTARHRRIGRYPVSVLISHVALDTYAPFEGGGFVRNAAYFLPPPGDTLPLVVSAVSDRTSAHLVVSGPQALLGGDALDGVCTALEAGIAPNPQAQ